MTAPVICVVGARPNYMKMAPIMRAFAAHSPAIPTLLVHTGQHYDAAMNAEDFFFDHFLGTKLPYSVCDPVKFATWVKQDRRWDVLVTLRSI